jgi:F-box domain
MREAYYTSKREQRPRQHLSSMSMTLRDLPEDILILITKYLDVIDIITLRRVWQLE